MAYGVEVMDLEPTDTAVVQARVPFAEIGATVGGAIKDVWEHLSEIGMGSSGMAFGRFRPGDGLMDVEVGFSVPRPVPGNGRVVPSSLPGGPAAVTIHAGPYDEIGPAYEAVQAWARANNRQIAGDPWEVYLTPPDQTPPMTRVVLPLVP